MFKYLFRVHKKACADVCVTADDADSARDALDTWIDDEDESADFHNAMDNSILVVDDPVVRPLFEHVPAEFYIDAKDFIRKEPDKYMLVLRFPAPKNSCKHPYKETYPDRTMSEISQKLEDLDKKYIVRTIYSKDDEAAAKQWNNACISYYLEERK